MINKNNSLAILIDLWEPVPNRPNTHMIPIFNDNIFNFLNSEIISTAVLATYNLTRSEFNSDTIWYRNERSFLKNNETLIKQLDTDFQYHLDVSKYANSAATRPEFLNYINDNIFQVAMREMWELLNYLDKNKNIENIFVLGVAWDICVRIRPLGYISLYEHLSNKNIKILTNKKCVLDQNRNYVNFDNEPLWQHISDDVYQYMPVK